MEDMEILFNGIDALNEDERRIADKVSKHHYPKIQRGIKNITSLVVHIKTQRESKESSRQQQKMFSVHVHVNAPTKTIRSSKADDWDLARSLHKAFNDVRRQIGHAFKD